MTQSSHIAKKLGCKPPLINLPVGKDTGKRSLFTQSQEGFLADIQKLGIPSYRAAQIFHWIYEKKCSHPQQMLNLPSDLRDFLSSHYETELPQIKEVISSLDGSQKILLQSDKNQLFEAVILPYGGRVSLCVSSQVGCKLACSFCQTGKLGFFRNLSAHEIISQLVIANQLLKAHNKQVTHVVFMGMGEPLLNFDGVMEAVHSMMNHFNLSSRRVTVSTSGIVPKIDAISHHKVSLAVSLHAANDALRSELMPINNKYSLDELKQALLRHQQRQQNQKLTIEYILIKDKNCSVTHAKQLVHYLHGLKAKVNLIPFNKHPGLPFDSPTQTEIDTFQKYLSQRGYPAPVRYSKGGDVSAACGQLAAKSLEQLSSPPQRQNIVGHKLSTTLEP